MDALKRQAAARALEHVQDGMKLGLGTGSTARHFVDLLGEKVRTGMKVVGVPTSEATRAQAQACGIPLTMLDDIDRLDLTVDGADEMDPALNLIKGGGGALLREKIVATASDRMIVIADESKWVETLGRFPLPVEVIPFGLAATQRAIAGAFAESGVSGPMAIRKAKDGHVFVTDGGHWIVDAHLGRITDPARQVHVAELYAPFSNTEYHSIEATGLAGLGQSVAQLRAGRFSLGGEIPVNPSGGTLCTNAIAVTAMMRAAEIALQVWGRAGERQVPGAKLGIASGNGGDHQFFGTMVIEA